VAEFRARARAHGREVGFNMSVRPIIAATEGAAWDKARRILTAMTGRLGWSRQEGIRAPVDNAGRRQFVFAEMAEVHDERLWMGITKATGALGNTSCLVGTPEQVANAILAYYRLGIGSFLIRGFDPVADATEFGRELIPRIKAGALEIDRRAA
jgi:alkanesulfonate monooxygenase